MVNYKENASLLAYNTFGMDVKAKWLIEYDSEEDLASIFADSRVKGQPFWCVGQGSNLLFTADYEGVILHGNIKGISLAGEMGGEQLIEVGAAERFDDVCDWAVAHNLYGAENLSAIPGETGAAAVQNIGAYGAEFKDICVAVAVFDIEQQKNLIIGADDLDYGYRWSRFKEPAMKQRFVITSVLLRLHALAKGEEPQFNLEYGNIRAALADQPLTLQNVRNTICQIRAAKLPDPAVLGNAGSFFKNPVIETARYEALLKQYPNMPHYDVDDTHVKVPAGWLIENAGLKGYRLGGAQVYEKQCLVLVNADHATPADLVNLCQHVVNTVNEKYAIAIEPEVNLI